MDFRVAVRRDDLAPAPDTARDDAAHQHSGLGVQSLLLGPLSPSSSAAASLLLRSQREGGSPGAAAAAPQRERLASASPPSRTLAPYTRSLPSPHRRRQQLQVNATQEGLCAASSGRGEREGELERASGVEGERELSKVDGKEGECFVLFLVSSASFDLDLEVLSTSFFLFYTVSRLHPKIKTKNTTCVLPQDTACQKNKKTRKQQNTTNKNEKKNGSLFTQ